MDIKNLVYKASREGLPLPGAYDASTDKPSSTLLFMYIANMVALGSVIYLTIKDPIAGAVAACLFSTVNTVLYLMRRLQKASFDLDDKSINLESEDEEKQ